MSVPVNCYIVCELQSPNVLPRGRDSPAGREPVGTEPKSPDRGPADRLQEPGRLPLRVVRSKDGHGLPRP